MGWLLTVVPTFAMLIGGLCLIGWGVIEGARHGWSARAGLAVAAGLLLIIFRVSLSIV